MPEQKMRRDEDACSNSHVLMAHGVTSSKLSHINYLRNEKHIYFNPKHLIIHLHLRLRYLNLHGAYFIMFSTDDSHSHEENEDGHTTDDRLTVFDRTILSLVVLLVSLFTTKVLQIPKRVACEKSSCNETTLVFASGSVHIPYLLSFE
jgi:hypothetical protein